MVKEKTITDTAGIDTTIADGKITELKIPSVKIRREIKEGEEPIAPLSNKHERLLV